MAARTSRGTLITLSILGCAALGAAFGAFAIAFSFPVWIAGAAVPLVAPLVWRFMKRGGDAR